MDEVVKEFLVESYENLDRLDQDLLVLEKDPRDKKSLDSIFRTIHTIKGTCGFIGFGKLEKVAHVGENLLSKMREGELVINPEIATALLTMVDATRKMLSQIEETGQEGDGDYTDLVNTLTQLASGEKVAASASATPPPAVSVPNPEPVKPSVPPASEPVASAPAVSMPAKEEKPIPPAAPKASASTEGTGAESSSRKVSDTSIRVDVALLDKLMNLVGELVLARNQILQFSTSQKDNIFINTSQRLNLITTELQEGVMKTRMQPIDNIWNKFPRVVRDLSIQCGKQIRVEMEGKETDLDRTIIEAIKDPLTHVVRNSVDHGIETPEVRKKNGKPAEGCLLLRAYHEGGQVNIEITDDGGGINPEKVKASALKKGLITPEQAARMGDRELIGLIFLPGFSTAEKITNVSGRGVGMDVVKTNIEKIGGTLDIQSKLGEGCTLKIKIPLTLAIIPALMITSGGDRYAIPQVSLLELVRLDGEQARDGVEMIHGSPVYRLRGKLLPLVYLNHVLGVSEGAVGEKSDSVNIVVLQADGRQFGLVVDTINDTEEIVVKPLGKQLKGIPSFAGATIMGDGRVALILDILGIAQMSKVVSEVHERSSSDKDAATEGVAGERQTMLVVGLGNEERAAIPLSLLDRLEEFPRNTVEKVGAEDVVQYRGQIMPLIYLSRFFHSDQTIAEKVDTLQVVVYSQGGRSVGLVVEKILDIVEEKLQVQQKKKKGLSGLAVIQQHVTELLDLQSIIRAAESDHASEETVESK